MQPLCCMTGCFPCSSMFILSTVPVSQLTKRQLLSVLLSGLQSLPVHFRSISPTHLPYLLEGKASFFPHIFGAKIPLRNPENTALNQTMRSEKKSLHRQMDVYKQRENSARPKLNDTVFIFATLTIP
jgi:hypothetical protein